MAKRRAQPLRNAQAASRKIAHKRARKSARRPKAAELARSPEEMFPEILELPFCKYVGRPPGEDQCDWWSVPVGGEDVLADDLLGRYYALLTARFLHESREKDPEGIRASVLLRIFGRMIERGHFWADGRKAKHDAVALGFVSCISDIMRRAYGGATVLNLASDLGEHYATAAKQGGKDRFPSHIRAALAKAGEQHRHFVVESSERRREARP